MACVTSHNDAGDDGTPSQLDDSQKEFFHPIFRVSIKWGNRQFVSSARFPKLLESYIIWEKIGYLHYHFRKCLIKSSEFVLNENDRRNEKWTVIAQDYNKQAFIAHQTFQRLVDLQEFNSNRVENCIRDENG